MAERITKDKMQAFIQAVGQGLYVRMPMGDGSVSASKTDFAVQIKDRGTVEEFADGIMFNGPGYRIAITPSDYVPAEPMRLPSGETLYTGRVEGGSE